MVTGNPERICPSCSYRTSVPTASLCPLCNLPLRLQERTWAPARRVPRTTLRPPLQGLVDRRIECLVLDLSIFGARLEHDKPLRSGRRYVLDLPVREDGSLLQLPVRVVWSRVERSHAGRGQEGSVYQSGIEFRGVFAAAERELTRFLGGIRGTHPGPLHATLGSPPD